MACRSAVALSICLILAAAGCRGGTSSPRTERTRPSSSAQLASPAATPRPSGLPTGETPVEMDPADFTADITNRYWPMKPLTRWTYREVDGTGAVSEVVVVATTKTKKIANGVTARVVRDTVRTNGEIIDTTPLEPTVSEYKLYAPGVGPVVTLGTSGGIGREELIKLDKAGPGDGTGPLGRPNG